MTASPFTEDHGPQEGAILMWTGSLSNIPEGWALCDGNNGTPNLMDRFVKSVPDTSTDPGTTGGENTKSLSTSQMASHTHSGSTDSVSNHSHGYNWSKDSYGSGSASSAGGDGTSPPSVEYAGGHTHNVSVGTTGGDGSYENRPEHYEVAFIMRL